MSPFRVEVEVFTVEKIVSLKVCVWPLREVVETEVPCKSTSIVEVDRGKVVVFGTIFVVSNVEVKVWPGNILVL